MHTTGDRGVAAVQRAHQLPGDDHIQGRWRRSQRGHLQCQHALWQPQAAQLLQTGQNLKCVWGEETKKCREIENVVYII